MEGRKRTINFIVGEQYTSEVEGCKKLGSFQLISVELLSALVRDAELGRWACGCLFLLPSLDGSQGAVGS